MHIIESRWPKWSKWKTVESHKLLKDAIKRLHKLRIWNSEYSPVEPSDFNFVIPTEGTKRPSGGIYSVRSAPLE